MHQEMDDMGQNEDMQQPDMDMGDMDPGMDEIP